MTRCKDRYYIYILRCSDGSYYAGYTKDPRARIKQHNAGKGAKCLRGKLPVRLVYVREFASLSPALRAERAIKQLKRKQKEALVKGSTANCK